MIIQETPTLNAQFDKARNDSDMLSLIKSFGGTFTRGSETLNPDTFGAATYTDALGKVNKVKSGYPRPNFVDGVNQGLLIEEERTNFLQRSEEFDNAVWSKGQLNTTGTPPWVNVITAPDGTLTAEKLIANTSNAFHNILQNVTLSSSGSYVVSAFVKPDEESVIAIRLRSDSFVNGFLATFNLITKAISGSNVGTGTFVSGEIEEYNDGWLRIIAIGTIPSVTNVNLQYELRGAQFTGNNTDGLFLWGTDLQAGSFPTSYIPTAGETVTRGAEVVKIEGASFTNFYNQNEGCFIIDFKINNTLNSLAGLIDFGATASDSIDVRLQTSRFRYLGNTATSQWALAVDPNNNQNKLSGTYKTGNASLFFNGAKINEDTSLVIPTVANILEIGRIDANSSFTMSGSIKRLIYYPKALPDTDVQLLTRI